MKSYAIENDMLKHSQTVLISSFKLENGTDITSLIIFCLELGLKCTKVYRFFSVLSSKKFQLFLQSVVDVEEKEIKTLHQELSRINVTCR